MEVFTAAPHHDVFLLLLRLAILLFTARALGELAARLGQPSVIGEILAGIILGPSLISGFFPALGAWIVPQGEVQGYLLEVVSLLGALFLLTITGLETDLSLIQRHARTALGVSIGGILVTFSSGFLLGNLLPDDFLANPERRLVFALFLATAMSISAIPVIAKVLMDMKLMRRDIGQTILAAGMSDDTVGWMLLSVVAGLAAGEALGLTTIGMAVGKVLLFLLISFTVGRVVAKYAVSWVQDHWTSPDRFLSLAMVLILAWGAFAHGLGLEAVLGAFIMGILLGQLPRFPAATHHKLQSLALGIFAPIFFATAGLKVDASALVQPQILAVALIVIAIATLGKVIGTYLGARLIGRKDHWTALSFGAALNARGAMEIIVATIGLSVGVLNQTMFSIIVVMAMATSLMAPPLLRFVLARLPENPEEAERLKREELAQGSLVAGIRRVLVPVRIRPGAVGETQKLEAQVLMSLSQTSPISATLFTVAESGKKAEALEFLNNLAERFPVGEVGKKVIETRNLAEAILDEARRDYDLLILGATEKSGRSDVLFSPLVDYLVRLAPCPTLVVRGSSAQSAKRILVPTNGAAAAKHAAEVAFALAASGQASVEVLNIVTQHRDDYGYALEGQIYQDQLNIASQIVDELCQLGESWGAVCRPQIRVGREAEDEILSFAQEQAVDLIVLGTDLRPGSNRLFLGPRVERILNQAPCSVLVVNVP